MSRERVGLLGLLATGALLLSAGLAASPAAAASDHDLGISSVAAVAPAEGGDWWVLERDLDGGGGIVYRYTADWEPAGETYRLRLPPAEAGRYRSFSPTDLARARGGGWWVVGAEGRVYRFAADFTFAGESYGLPRPDSEYNATSAYGVQRARGGGWWVAANRNLWRADERWVPVEGTPDSVGVRRGGYAVAAGYGGPTRLWVLGGYLGSGVAMFRLADDGSRIDPSAVKTPTSYVGAPPTYAVAEVSYELQMADVPVDFARSGGHWWVADADGQVHQYDRYWRYTGRTHAVGSGDAVGSYPSDVVSFGVVLVPIVSGLGWLAPGAVVLLGLWWRRGGVDRIGLVWRAAGALWFVYGVVLSPHFARPLVFANGYLPFVVTVAALALPALDVYRAVSDGDGPRAKPLVVAYAPVVLGALSTWTAAVRPLTPPYF